MSNIQPAFLKSGDKVCVISTARKVLREEIEPALAVLNNWGLELVLGANLFLEHDQFAGTDAQRLLDLQNALDDPEISAIFCARGGYGTARIMDSIVWDEFLKYPKWVIGFSDVTILLNSIQNQGICSLHAPMPLFFTKLEYQYSIETMKRFLFGENTNMHIARHPLDKTGTVSGVLVGGNLSLIVNSIGTKTAFDPAGKILFLEDIDEYLYHIDRMMLHLKRAGILEKLAGLVIGHFTDMKDNAIPFGETAYQIIARNVAEYAFPVAFACPVGHEPQNMPFPIGKTCALNVYNTKTTLDFL